MQRTTMTIDGTAYLLAQGQDAGEIEEATVGAVREGGAILSVTIVGNRQLDVLVSQGVAVSFETGDVEDDVQDDGDVDAPFTVPHYDDDSFYHPGDLPSTS